MAPAITKSAPAMVEKSAYTDAARDQHSCEPEEYVRPTLIVETSIKLDRVYLKMK